jgi:integrase
MAKKLTAVAVAKARAGAGRREIPDLACPGLYLIIQPSGVKSYAARFRSRRRSVKFTLGPVLDGVRAESAEAPQLGAPLSLTAARRLCAKVLHEAKAGRDPAAERRKQREREHAADSDTLRAVSELFLRREGPKLRSLDQRRADLELFYPALGALPVAEIRRSQFVSVLDRVENERGPVRSDRALGAIKRLLAWYSERDDDYVSVLVPVGRRTNTKERARSRVLDDGEIRRVWMAAETFGTFGDLVRFLLTTCARRNEAAGLLRRSELSADGKTWTIPAARSKTKADLVIPLSRAAQAVVAARPVLGDFVFSTGGKVPFSDFSRAKAAFDAACGVSGWTIHDLRRTARTLLSRCDVRPDIAERCLGHAVGNIQAVYDRHGYESEMRAAFEALAAQIERIVRPPPPNVVSIRRAKRARR